DTIDRREADTLAAPVFVGRHEEHAEAAEAGEGIVRVLRLLGARDDEVVLAVAGGDEELLPRHEPVAVRVLLAFAAELRHVASGVGLGDVHASPGFAAHDLTNEWLEASL